MIFSTWASQDMTLLISTGTCLIVVPIVAIIYSYMIFNMKCMASGRGNENVNNGGENGAENRADAADLNEI